MTLNKKNIFFIDAVGAALSAALIGLVLPIYVTWVGLPIKILHLLATIALVYAIFSLFCYWFVERAKKFLLIIMFANLLYCVLTLGVIISYSSEITTWGRLYFISEILVILVLVSFERSVYRKLLVYYER